MCDFSFLYIVTMQKITPKSLSMHNSWNKFYQGVFSSSHNNYIEKVKTHLNTLIIEVASFPIITLCNIHYNSDFDKFFLEELILTSFV